MDKTGLIEMVNKSLGTIGKPSCVSKSKCFGKSYAEKIVCRTLFQIIKGKASQAV